MPNWCYNQLEIHGSERALLKLIEFIESDEATTLFWNTHHPREYELEKYEKSGWYDWNTINWGTKWDVSLSEVQGFKQIQRDDIPYSLVWHFETAWTPPSPWLLKLCKRFPSLYADLVFTEEGCNFVGRLKIENAKVVMDVIGDAEHQTFIDMEMDCQYCDEGWEGYYVCQQNSDGVWTTNIRDAEEDLPIGTM